MARIEQLQAFLAVTPDDDFVRHALALEYIKIGDDQEARKLFETILLHNPAYIGSYYHLAKLLERNQENEMATAWYEKGIQQAKKANDQHALGELVAAYENLKD